MTYADLEAAPAVLLVGLEPEEESPIVFLRLRKAAPQAAARGLRGRPARHAAAWTSWRHAAAGRARRRGRVLAALAGGVGLDDRRAAARRCARRRA